MTEKMKAATAADFVRAGYEVRPTSNGGYIVTKGLADLRGISGDYRGGPDYLAAFTNGDDFRRWLSEGLIEVEAA